MKDILQSIVEARLTDYAANFGHVEHTVAFEAPPAATLRLHFVKTDASGQPRFRELAYVLAKYITTYCFTAERSKDLQEQERNEMYMQARDLFRRTANSGQLGELLIYFLLETVLNAPQALKKMPLTTNPKEERKGSDGVHLLWDEPGQVLELIFAESKIWKSFSSALTDAFESMESFHDDRAKQHEVNVITSGFSALDSKIQEQVAAYVEGENVSKCRHAHACLIGFNWSEYGCLTDTRRATFIKEFDQRYLEWAAERKKLFQEKLRKFRHKHIRLEFFIIPFQDVEAFRAWFEQALTGQE